MIFILSSCSEEEVQHLQELLRGVWAVVSVQELDRVRAWPLQEEVKVTSNEGRGKPRKYYRITTKGKEVYLSMLEDYLESKKGVRDILQK